MRFLRLLLVVYLFSISVFAQAPRDAQAISTVEAAITALGGPVAIGQVRSWTFQAQMQGPKANGNVTYVMDDQPSKRIITTKKGSKHTLELHSFFVPAVPGALLSKELKDATLSMQFRGVVLSNSKPLTIVSLSARSAPGFADQTWYFDASAIPVRVEFRVPGELGSNASFSSVVGLSDYRSVDGAKYPFQIVTQIQGALAEIIEIKSLTTSTTAPTFLAVPNGEAGDSL